MNQNEYYTLPNAMAKLGVTYKTIRYYAEHELFANDESLVRFEGKKKWVSEKFIEKVRHNLETNSSRFKDPRTKDELIGEVERLNGLYNEATKKIEEFKTQLSEANTEIARLNDVANELFELGKRSDEKIKKAKKKIKELESEKPFEIEEGKRVEVFTDEEYSLFEQRLREWHNLHKEMRLKDEHFMSQLNTKDEMIAYARQQSEYHRQQADKQLEQMDKLLGYLKDRNLREAERAQIEAVEKRVIPRQDGYDPYGSTQR